MVQRDGGLRPTIHKHLKVGMMWVSIETWSVSAGVPDSWYLADGGTSGWVESKRAPVKFRPGQIGWLVRCARMGGRCFVAVRDQRRGDDLVLFNGADSGRIDEVGSDHFPPVGRWPGGQAKWDWDEVRRIITT